MGNEKNPERAHGAATPQGGRALILALVAACALAVGGWALLRSWSPGTTRPVVDDAGSPVPGALAEKIFVDIRGVRQGMFIRSSNPSNPILLFVHGGPGMPEYFLDELYPTGWESRFTVCWWEQRGAGLSYRPGMPGDSVTVDALVEDTLAVADYLRIRFGKQKILLVAHSWGTFLGIRAAARAPERFLAYVGIGQISDQAESERRAYDYMVERYEAAENEKRLRKLWKYPVSASDDALRAFFGSLLRDASMHELGIGTMRSMRSVMGGIFIPVWRSRAYTLAEKWNLWRAKAFLAKETDLRLRMLSARLEEEVPRLEVPAYFVSGAYDYTVSRDLSKRYLSKLEAPIKGFYTFEESAHSPMFEEPGRFLGVLTDDVMAGRTSLADRD